MYAQLVRLQGASFVTTKDGGDRADRADLSSRLRTVVPSCFSSAMRGNSVSARAHTKDPFPRGPVLLRLNDSTYKSLYAMAENSSFYAMVENSAATP